MTDLQPPPQKPISAEADLARRFLAHLLKYPTALEGARHPDVATRALSSVARVLALMAEGQPVKAARNLVETDEAADRIGEQAQVLDRADVAELRGLALVSLAHHREMQESIRRGRDRILARATGREEAARWAEKTLAHHIEAEQASAAQLARYDQLLATDARAWRCERVA